MPIKSNYDIQADKCKLEFIKMDHKKIAEKFNLKYDEDYLYIYFFSTKYRLNKRTGHIEKTYDNSNYIPAKFNEIMTLLDVLAYSKEDLSLSSKWINVTNLKEVFRTGGTVTHTDLFAASSKKFSGKTDQLIKACEKLKGRKISQGDVGYIIDIFDYIKVMFVYYDEDSDFESEIKVLWTDNILKFVHYETTYYMLEYLFEKMLKIIEE